MNGGAAVSAGIEPALAHWIGWTLLHSFWLGAALAAMLAIVLRWAIPRRAANARYLAACATLVAMAALPPLTPRPQSEETGPSSSSAIALDRVEELATAALPVRTTGAWALEKGRELMPWMATAWLIGVVVLASRLLGGWVWSRRISRRRTGPVDSSYEETLKRLSRKLGIRRTVRLAESAMTQVPAVLGWARPVILLPAAALTGLTPSQLEAILAHELAHVRRYDYAVNLIQCMLETLLFHHPAARWVSRIIREERENCCDDLAVAACGNRLAFAQALARLESMRSASLSASALSMPLSLAADGGSLLDRIRRILEQDAELEEDFMKTRAVGWSPLPALRDVVGLAALALTAVGLGLAISARDAQAQAQTQVQARTQAVPAPTDRLSEVAIFDVDVDGLAEVVFFTDETSGPAAASPAPLKEKAVVGRSDQGPLAEKPIAAEKRQLLSDSKRYLFLGEGGSPHCKVDGVVDLLVGKGDGKAVAKKASLTACNRCHASFNDGAALLFFEEGQVGEHPNTARVGHGSASFFFEAKKQDQAPAPSGAAKPETKKPLVFSVPVRILMQGESAPQAAILTRSGTFRAEIQNQTEKAPNEVEVAFKTGVTVADGGSLTVSDKGHTALRLKLTTPQTVQESSHPSDREIVAKLKLTPDGDVLREDVQIRVELVRENIEAPKVYPIAGRCSLVRRHYKCTVHFDEKAPGAAEPKRRVEVIYLDKEFLQPAPAPAPAPVAPSSDDVDKKLDAVIQDLKRIKSAIKP